MMKTFRVVLWILVALLAARLHAQSYSDLYTFSTYSGFPPANADAALPYCTLALTNGTLYGTSYEGGKSGEGALYSIHTDGTGFTNLHSFSPLSSTFSGDNSDGAQLFSSLLIYSNQLYGTSTTGGASGFGTIFRLNFDGSAFTNLHSFPNSGGSPYAELIAVSNVLYGTSSSGGSLVANYGSIFRIDPSGSHFTNIISFYPSATNVAFGPRGGLLYANGKFYGTCSASSGTNSGGTIFSIGIDGRGYSNLYVFQAVAAKNRPTTNTSGGTPSGTLTLIGDTLYGTTPNGGTNGNGVVFSINTNGSNFKVLHTFSLTSTGGENTNSDGAGPQCQLLAIGNTLYGTAPIGGPASFGTLFSINTDGSNFNIVWGFPYIAGKDFLDLDGESPAGGLIASGTTVFGTSLDGGLNGNIYALNLAPSNPLPTLGLQPTNNSLILTWDTATYTLQSTSILGTAFTNLPGASSPFTVVPTFSSAFFRLIHK
jgi:uncharacterized repeat protein (TIGR03803 family)